MCNYMLTNGKSFRWEVVRKIVMARKLSLIFMWTNLCKSVGEAMNQLDGVQVRESFSLIYFLIKETSSHLNKELCGRSDLDWDWNLEFSSCLLLCTSLKDFLIDANHWDIRHYSIVSFLFFLLLFFF